MDKKPHIVALTDFAPYVGGIGKTNLQKLITLSKNFKISLITLYDRDNELPLPPYIDLHRLHLLPRLISKDTKDISSMIKSIGPKGIIDSLSNAALKSFPLYYGAFADSDTRIKVKAKILSLNPDAILAYRYLCSELVDGLQKEERPVFLDIGDRISNYYKSISAHPNTSNTKKIMALTDGILCRQYESRLLDRATAIFYVSKRDIGVHADEHNVQPWPLFFDPTLPKLRQTDKIYDLIMLGDWPTLANLDMLEYSIDEIFPHLPKDIRIAVVGPRPPKELIEKSPIKLDVLGFVDDLDSTLQSAHAMLAPVRLASGTQTKILDGLKNGLPAITSPIAKEGIDPPDSTPAIMVCKSTDEYINNINSLLKKSPDLNKESQAAYSDYVYWAQVSQKKAIDIFKKRLLKV